MDELSADLRRVLALLVLALTFGIVAVGLVAPAAANAGVTHARATQAQAHADLRSAASAKKPKKAKHAAGHPWGKKDIAEIAALAIAPFAIMGLLMFASGYRRMHKAAPGRTHVPMPEKEGSSR